MHRQVGAGKLRSVRLVALVVTAVLLVLPTQAAHAHPLGNFTINHYSRLEFKDDAVHVRYILDYAEIPTFQQKAQLDLDEDGALSPAEAGAYLDAQLPRLVAGLHLEINNRALPLQIEDRSAAYSPGQGGLPVLRVEAELVARLPPGWQQNGSGSYTDTNYTERLGWREIVMQDGRGVAIGSTSISATDVSDELRAYPQDMLSSPLDQREARFTLLVGDGSSTSQTAGEAAENVQEKKQGGAATDRLASLVSKDRLTPAAIAIALLAAFFWGAAHALTPGHGKAVVAAYLIGSRGTARHAAFLGLTVTVTHTAGVFALGAVTIFLSRYILPEQLYPWLSVASGLLVVVIGLTLLYRRAGVILGGRRRVHEYSRDMHAHTHTVALSGAVTAGGAHAATYSAAPTTRHDKGSHAHREHEHSHSETESGHDHTHDHGDGGHAHSHGDDTHEHGHTHAASDDHDHGIGSHSHDGHTHSHLPPGVDGSRVTWRSLLALGVSGGLIPCPSALVLLLSAISLGRLGFGMVMVVAFSLGLAGVLTVIGLLLVYARKVFERHSFEARTPRLLPVGSALAITVAGLVILLGALRQAGVV